MPFERPTLSDLVDRIRSDFRSRLGIDGALVRRAVADVLAVTWSSGIHMVYGFLDWVVDQLFADTAEEAYLLRKAAMYGITPIPAEFAEGSVTALGEEGSVIPEDTILVRDDAFTYRVTAEATVGMSGQALLAVTAVLAGEDGNLEGGEALTFESPISGVDANANVTLADPIEGGLDEEDVDGVRARLLLRLRQPPTGGSDQDYEAWALEVAGTTRAWVYRHEDGLGTVTVRFVRDEDEDGIFPDGADVTEMQTHLDSERPVTAEVTAAAPDPLEVDFTIELTPDTSAVRNAVIAELTDLFRRLAEPGDGVTDRGVVLISKIRTAIDTADGVEDYILTAPTADVEPDLGELAVVGEFTWV